jgi:hypothetical protein
MIGREFDSPEDLVRWIWAVFLSVSRDTIEIGWNPNNAAIQTDLIHISVPDELIQYIYWRFFTHPL